MSGIQRTFSQPPFPKLAERPREVTPEVGALFQNFDDVMQYLLSQRQAIDALYGLLARALNDRHMVGVVADLPTAAEAGRQYLQTDNTPNIFRVDDGSSWQTFPAWVVPLDETLGGTGATSYAIGDVLSADSTTSLSKIAAVAAGKTFKSNGVSTLPLWVDASPSTATVATTETTTSTSYTDLATAGPAVTIAISAIGKALVHIGAELHNNTTPDLSFMSFAVSGATTVAAADSVAIYLTKQTSLSDPTAKFGASFLVTGLTAGNNTFTAKYRASAGTARFSRRDITVVPY